MREAHRLHLLSIESSDQIGIRQARVKRKSMIAKVLPGTYGETLTQAGIFIKREQYVALVLIGSLCIGSVLSKLGLALGIFGAISAGYYFTFWYLEERALKRRSKIVPQLPAFIDGLASALSTGFNIESAVVQAAQSIPPGLLKTELDRVISGLDRGLTLEESFVGAKHRIAGNEMISVSICITLFQGMGGRMLEPFRRLARKVREQEIVSAKANRDLVTVKQAFWIIFFLSWSAPAILMVTQPGYLNGALADPLGRLILQIAVMIEISALLLFKRLSTIKI